jgi:cytochrome oxidase assembly protein ShyY1
MAKFANTQPVFLDMVETENKLEIPIGSQTIINLRNEHWNYILTWFGLSASTGYCWYRTYLKSRLIYKI